MRAFAARRLPASAAMLDVSISTRLDDFTLDVAFASEARIVALFGASGAGKSQTIAAIAGLTKPAQGRIALG